MVAALLSQPSVTGHYLSASALYHFGVFYGLLDGRKDAELCSDGYTKVDVEGIN